MVTNSTSSHKLTSTLPIENISDEDIKDFCELRLEEDIDLDYKADWPNDLSRLICAFANTQGGTILIEIEEEGKSRKPITPPTGINGDEDVLHQKANNIAYDGIFPPVNIEVGVRTNPEDPRRSIVVIRVKPTRLVHATDRRTRIYIRVADNNRGYDLASLSDLQWLWNQREEAIALREMMVSSAEIHSHSNVIKWHDSKSEQRWVENPFLIVSCVPGYPGLVPVSDSRNLLGIANDIGEVKSDLVAISMTLPSASNLWRTIAGGVAINSRGGWPRQHYIELGERGLFYCSVSVPSHRFDSEIEDSSSNHHYLESYSIMGDLGLMLKYANEFYKKLGWRWPIILKIKLVGVQNLRLNYQTASSNHIDIDRVSPMCIDDEILLEEREIGAQDIYPRHEEILLKAATSLLWTFGIGWEGSSIRQWLMKLKGGGPLALTTAF